MKNTLAANYIPLILAVTLFAIGHHLNDPKEVGVRGVVIGLSLVACSLLLSVFLIMQHPEQRWCRLGLYVLIVCQSVYIFSLLLFFAVIVFLLKILDGSAIPLDFICWLFGNLYTF